jgi:hypothetical protein
MTDTDQEKITHPEWEMENSLITRSERDSTKKSTFNPNAPPLTSEELGHAMKELVVTDFVEKFPRVERFYADPVDQNKPDQVMGLFSFVPSQGAKPDKNGIYGMAKLRGNYSSPEEMKRRTEYILKEVDSYHKIYYTYVGRPFPCTVSSKYSADTDEVEIRSDVTRTISQNIKSQKKKDQKDIQDIQERTEELYADTDKEIEDVDPYDLYITLKVKTSQLSWTYLEHKKKMEEIETIIKKSRVEITELDETHPEFQTTFFDKYMDARKKAGLEQTDESFIKYMVQDADLGF